jgi:prepilin signal peptidase PulO-like enzyme (type II secretory pathway)
VEWLSGHGLPMLLGGVLGFLTGVLVWVVARGLSPGPVSSLANGGADGLRASLRQVHGSATIGSSLVQGAMALWGAYVIARTGSLGHLVGALWVTGSLAALSIIDFRVRRIPDPLVLAVLLWAPVQALWLGYPSLSSIGLGLLVGGGLFLLLALLQRGAMGMGDVKLVAALGAILGYPSILYGVLCGVVLGGAAALVLLASRRAGRKDPMAYGPYLALGGWIVWSGAMGLWA